MAARVAIQKSDCAPWTQRNWTENLPRREKPFYQPGFLENINTYRRRQGRQAVAPVSFVGPPDVKNFKKFNDEGEFRVSAPHADLTEPTIDPVTTFISPAGEVQSNRPPGEKPSDLSMPTDKVTQKVPQKAEHDLVPAAPPKAAQTEERRSDMFSWHQQKFDSEPLLRGKLRRQAFGNAPVEKTPLRDLLARSAPGRMTKELQDRLAEKYIYTTSTQRQYEDVPFDDMYHAPPDPPKSTYERYSDQVGASKTKGRFYTADEMWRKAGINWDFFQRRRGYYGRHQDFCSHYPRASEIPCYGGSLGCNEDLDDRDNKAVSFAPLTIKRNPIPRYAETGHRPNVPGYTGCVKHEMIRHGAFHCEPPPEPQTSLSEHKLIPLGELQETLSVSSAIITNPKKRGVLGSAVTTVEPANPFNKRSEK